MSRKEMEIADHYEQEDADGFTADEQAEYEAWLDTFDANDRGDEGYSEPSILEPELADADLPF